MLKTTRCGIGALLVWCLFAGNPVEARTRVALVLGNSNYETARLRNPVNDARLMAETLQGLGFEVIERLDADQKTMKRAIRQFGDALDSAGRDAVGLFYFAGHGIRVSGTNYLVPIGAEIKTERDVDIETISASSVLRTIEFARNNLNIVILDACRNNPYARTFRSSSNGLAEMKAATGTLIAYATAPGQLAIDGLGDHSPYTSALVRNMSKEGIPVERTFKQVRIAVSQETRGLQIPWESSSLTGEFYFKKKVRQPKSQNLVAGLQVKTTPLSPSATSEPSQGTGNRALELLFWQSIINSQNAPDFEAYLKQFPNGAFAPLARNRLAKLKTAKSAKRTQVPVAGTGSRPGRDAFHVDVMDQEFIALKSANVREMPSTRSQKVGRLASGTVLTVTGKTKDSNWYQVEKPDGSEGYVYAPLLEDAATYNNRKSDSARLAQLHARKEEETRLTEERARKAEEARLAEERARKAEEARLAEERARKAEEARLAEERAGKAEEARLAEERAGKAEEARLAEERARKAEEARLAEERARKAEEARLAEERARKAEEARLAEENRRKLANLTPAGKFEGEWRGRGTLDMSSGEGGSVIVNCTVTSLRIEVNVTGSKLTARLRTGRGEVSLIGEVDEDGRLKNIRGGDGFFTLRGRINRGQWSDGFCDGDFVLTQFLG